MKGRGPIHFTDAKGWSPRVSQVVSACGKLVPIGLASRDSADVTCEECKKTTVYQASFDEMLRSVLP